MKKTIIPFEYAASILSALKKGILLTTKAHGKVNTMTIAWGTLGIEWNMALFTVFVRKNRFTRQMLDQNPEFTINVPWGTEVREILAHCGTTSGRDSDKIADLNLTLEEPEIISVPGIQELPLTLECKVIYKQTQDPAAMPPEVLARNYPQNVSGGFPGSNRDYHTAYYGQIVAAYIIE